MERGATDEKRSREAERDPGVIEVEVRLFAVFRERAGRDRLTLELPAKATVADALAAAGREPGLGEILAAMPVRAALNREYVNTDAAIADGDEVALIPPVSGGSGAPAASDARPHVRVTSDPLEVAEVSARVRRPGAGATVVFCGTTRDVERLEYEAYVEMATERIESILAECASRHGLQAAAGEHRIGSVPLSEPSVIVAVSAAHRAAAFAGAREVIDRIKAEAPIWKAEVEGSGEPRWVEGSEPPTGRDRPRLTHLDDAGSARMVDVGAKPETQRRATARARVRMSTQTAAALAAGDAPKGDVLGTARLAAIGAAKRTWELIPLAHPLALDFVDIEGRVDAAAGLVELSAAAGTTGRTGVEMEAMTACAVAALTVYDMVKGLERGVWIEAIELVAKSGGRSGEWRREA